MFFVRFFVVCCRQEIEKERKCVLFVVEGKTLNFPDNLECLAPQAIIFRRNRKPFFMSFDCNIKLEACKDFL